ncbi:MAG: YbdK family carboxylate-amine ligase [Bacteriovoracaceae bacterium]|nr:YbdK family carboxylate-amine ligase [Bacteriovoracaceae bacterium]
MRFKKNVNRFSLGVEIELQLIDKKTMDLRPCSQQILKNLKQKTKQVKSELFQSMIEINSRPHTQLVDLQSDLQEQVYLLQQSCQKMDVALSGTGTHPFARYNERIVTPEPRYKDLIIKKQLIARRLLIFGVHIHIGCTSKSETIELNNFFIHYLPLMQAMTASSPFWQGKVTGLLSSRPTIFEALPTGGHPEIFKNWKHFEETIHFMTKTKSIHSHKDLWWDLRPSPEYGTLELRACDGLNTIQEVMGLCYLIQGLCHLFQHQKKPMLPAMLPSNWIMRENKWRACRDGIAADLITPNYKLVSFKKSFDKLITSINKSNQKWRNDKFHKNLINMRKSTSALRQLRVFKETEDLSKVVSFNCLEFERSYR